VTNTVMPFTRDHAGVPIRLAPAILAEIAAAGHTLSDPEYPPGSRPAA
jgi:hypothetical protein